MNTGLGRADALRALVAYCQNSHSKKDDPLGGHWCQRKFIGRIRRELAPRISPNVLPFGPPTHIEAGKEALAEALRAECQACGKCPMWRE